ncbi:hypothetical protein D1007_41893 [Hordeum vulgare]|nr:hypothetical protein D1007_41893 [Hordeum vulgare]
MVFEEESNDDTSSLPYMHSSSSSINGFNQAPISLEDPNYKGLELDVFCEKHGKAAERLVAFEGIYTGRRFLACAEPLKLWAMVEESKIARVNDNLESAFTIHNLKEENNKLDANYDNNAERQKSQRKMAKKDAHREKLKQKYGLLCNLTNAQAIVIQNLKFKNMKEKELLSEAKMNLELKNAKFTKFEENLSQEKLELNF